MHHTLESRYILEPAVSIMRYSIKTEITKLVRESFVQIHVLWSIPNIPLT
jgi:hypothetical protein